MYIIFARRQNYEWGHSLSYAKHIIRCIFSTFYFLHINSPLHCLYCKFAHFVTFCHTEITTPPEHKHLGILQHPLKSPVSNEKFTLLPIGESNVYTLGNIGAHRIVSTKLPSVGSTREAMTATGNTTTRLLGTFQKVDYVFVVGVAGGVPHYTDYKKHVRLGDVVISYVDKQRALLSKWVACVVSRM